MPIVSSAEVETEALPVAAVSAKSYAAAATAVAVLGVAAIAPSALSLWTMWTGDALKSVGMAIPAVCLVLILRAWKSIGWQQEGSWWGLPLVMAAIAGAWIEGHANLVLVFSPQTSRTFPPASLVVLLYGAGVVLLMGGRRLFRVTLFPILLLWFVNPVPRAFSLWVDLPLQRVAADMARSLAQHLGQTLTPDRLQLMFTPNFGMFIAPGCDGVRGSVTMGLIALVAGYVYRFRWSATALVTAGAVVLGYVFNLLRLCLLVVYYLVALHIPRLQNKAEQGDYIIGAALFLLATMLLFMAIERLRDAAPREEAIGAQRQQEKVGREEKQRPRLRWARLAAMGVLGTIGWIELPRTVAAYSTTGPQASAAIDPFPPELGQYVREREWNEATKDGPIIYRWAEYAPEGGGTPIAIGVSPVPDWHNPLICHSVRGEDPVWQGQMTAATASDEVEFSSALYNDGVSQQLEASTLCAGGSCGEYATRRTHFGFVFSFPNLKSIAGAGGQQSARVLLKAEKPDATAPGDATRNELTDDMRRFLAAVSLEEVSRPFGR
jgi:exosortase J